MTLGERWKTWIWDQFPYELRKIDSYKDNDNRGLLERYTEVFGEYMQELEVFSDNWLKNTKDIDHCFKEYLPLIAHDLGTPPNIFGTEDGFRKLLKNIVSIYKIKGTLHSYEVLFMYLGFQVQLIFEPFNPSIWDYPYEDDSQFPLNPLQLEALGLDQVFINWDDFNWDEVCQTCVYYTVYVNHYTDDPSGFSWTEVTPEQLDQFNNIVNFLNPVDGKVLGVIPQILIEEKIGIDMDEGVQVICYTYDIWDEIEWDDFEWDNTTETCNETYNSSLGDYNSDYNSDYNG